MGRIAGRALRAQGREPACVRRLFKRARVGRRRPPAGAAARPARARWAPERTGRRATRGPSARGLVREATTVPPGGCGERGGARPFGDVAEESCRPLSLVYVQEEPWAAAAARIAAVAFNTAWPYRFPASRRAKCTAERWEAGTSCLRSPATTTTASTRRWCRCCPAGNQNLSGGQAVSESPGRRSSASYESSIVYPPSVPGGRGLRSRPPERTSCACWRKTSQGTGRRRIYPLRSCALRR